LANVASLSLAKAHVPPPDPGPDLLKVPVSNITTILSNPANDEYDKTRLDDGWH
jgi:hypothetical protein